MAFDEIVRKLLTEVRQRQGIATPRGEAGLRASVEETHEIASSFARIGDPRLRQAILAIVVALAAGSSLPDL